MVHRKLKEVISVTTTQTYKTKDTGYPTLVSLVHGQGPN